MLRWFARSASTAIGIPIVTWNRANAMTLRRRNGVAAGSRNGGRQDPRAVTSSRREERVHTLASPNPSLTQAQSRHTQAELVTLRIALRSPRGIVA